MALPRAVESTIFMQPQLMVAARNAHASTPAPQVKAATIANIVLPDMPDAAFDGRLGEMCKRYLPGLPNAYRWPALLASGTMRCGTPRNGTTAPRVRRDTAP